MFPLIPSCNPLPPPLNTSVTLVCTAGMERITTLLRWHILGVSKKVGDNNDTDTLYKLFAGLDEQRFNNDIFKETIK